MPQNSDSNDTPAIIAMRPVDLDASMCSIKPGYTKPAIVFRTPLEAVANVCSGPGAKVRGICALENS